MLQPPALAPDPAPDPDPDLLSLADRDNPLEAEDHDPDHDGYDGRDANARAAHGDRHWPALAAPADGYNFLHELLSFIVGPLLGADESFGVAMVEHQERPKPSGSVPAPALAPAPVPALASALALAPALAPATDAAAATGIEGPGEDCGAPEMTRCIGQLRVPLPVRGEVVVEFCAAGYLRSVSATEPALGGGGGGGGDCESEYDGGDSDDAPLVAVVGLRGVRHRHAAVAAHLLAVAQMRFGYTTPPAANADATVDAIAAADANTNTKPTEREDDEIDAYAIGITHRPATPGDARPGDEQSGDAPLYTLYRTRIPRRWFAGLAAGTPPPLRIDTSAPFDPRADGKLPLADALLRVMAALVRTGIARVGADEARRRAHAARSRRRAAAARRWEAEQDSEAHARRLIALELRRAQAARTCGKVRQRKEPVFKARKRRRAEPSARGRRPAGGSDPEP